jgi:hypothetical protein
MLSLDALFCHVDDFCQWFEPRWQKQLLGEGLQQRRRARSLYLSQTMTILIAFSRHTATSSGSTRSWSVATGVKAFPGLVSYNRFRD